MAKFNWQNGTLVTPARVEIGGQVYDVTPEQYSGQTPLSAENLNQAQDLLIDLIWPVGSYYETSDDSFDPNISWGGTWELDSQGKITISQDTADDDFNALGKTGGSKTHTQTLEELAPHVHGIKANTNENATSGAGRWPWVNYNGINRYTESAGEGQPMDIMNPYIVVKRWHRTA